jgi:hypothetical protein
MSFEKVVDELSVLALGESIGYEDQAIGRQT